jgi:hypothetical protein
VPLESIRRTTKGKITSRVISKSKLSNGRFPEGDFAMVDAISILPVSPSPKSQRTRSSREGECSTHEAAHSKPQAASSPSNGRHQFERYHTLDIFHFESSDDDVPLQRTIPTQLVPSSPAARDNPPPNTIEQQSPPRRALRVRKPEQQMPYTLDLMRHRDQFRRRGLKPVHNPNEPHAREDDEQFQADEEEFEMDKDELYAPPKNMGERPPKRPRIDENQENSDNELEIRLLVGRKKFLAPDIPRKMKSMQQITRDREVSSGME